MTMVAKFSGNEVITIEDKQIPFTDVIIEAGTEGEIYAKDGYEYILKFYDSKTCSFLYLSYKISELSIKAEIKSIEFMEG